MPVPKLLVAVVLILAGFIVTPAIAEEADFKDLKTLKQAVEVVQKQLIADGKPEYVALVTETRVKEAIRKAVRAYEAGHLDDQEKWNRGSKGYFLKDIKPIALWIADKGEWPEHCSFFTFYGLRSKAGAEWIEYDGLGLRLQVNTPTLRRIGFALPVLDLYYGRAGD